MKDYKKETVMRYYREKGSSLIIGVAVMAIFLPLALPVLIELNSAPVSVDKPSKYSAALALAQAGVEKAIWEMNNGDITSWNGDSTLRITTLSSIQVLEGKESGDIEIRVKWPYEEYPVVEAVGRVVFTSPLKGRGTARIIVERKARTVLQKDGYSWTSVFPDAQASGQASQKGIM